MDRRVKYRPGGEHYGVWLVVHWKDTLTELALPADGRVPPVFKPYHVAVATVMIGRQQPLGRYELCENMSIGEGSVRTLLRRLADSGYITPEGRQGQKLTAEGASLFEDLTNDVPLGLFLNVGNLTVFKQSFANIVKGKAESVVDGIRQRDEAIIQGGAGNAGATTLVMKEGLLLMPPDDFNILSTYPEETLLITDSLRPEDGDAIVIGSSDDGNLAREVSMAAVMTLFEED
ncbi:DUF4443 domain-containing protein [Candidatus Thorarchaeota archaeon]|jgi:predicted transcriptional regulator|nr:MAG: DUF4443 domain-containing protein [Candidatus Thorarchaeota archaeon]